MKTAKRENHRRWRSAEYMSWASMKDRCLNKNSRVYAYYGGRGIGICDAWVKSFMAFYRDLGPRPGPHFTLERRDNSKGYAPDNCYWATMAAQSRNRRGNIVLEYQGEAKVAKDWARQFGIPKSTFLQRIASGWPIEKALAKDGHPTCERGHPWDATYKRGGRRCTACERIWDARKRAKRKASLVEMLQDPTNGE